MEMIEQLIQETVDKYYNELQEKTVRTILEEKYTCVPYNTVYWEIIKNIYSENYLVPHRTITPKTKPIKPINPNKYQDYEYLAAMFDWTFKDCNNGDSIVFREGDKLLTKEAIEKVIINLIISYINISLLGKR